LLSNFESSNITIVNFSTDARHLRFKGWTGSPHNSLGDWGVLLRDSAAIFVNFAGEAHLVLDCSAVNADLSILFVVEQVVSGVIHSFWVFRE